MPIRLLYCTDQPDLGGDTRAEWMFLAGADKSRFEITAFIPKTGTTAEAFQSIPHITCVPTEFGTSPSGLGYSRPDQKALSMLQLGKSGIAFVQAAKRLQPDLLFVGDRNRPMIVGLWAHQKTGIPLVYHPQFFYTDTFTNAARKRQLAETASLVITHSQHSLESYAHIGIPEQKIVVAHNATDLTRYTPGDGSAVRDALGIPADAVVIGISGVMRPGKGYDTLLPAFKLVREKVENAHLLIVGDGGLGIEWAREQSEALGIAPFVHLPGFQKDTVPYLRAMDIFTMASDEEPFGLVTIEAMACEKPVVGTDSGGTPEIVVAGETGLLVPPKSPARMADALITLCPHPARRQQMGKAGRERALQCFTTERRTHLITQALIELVESRTTSFPLAA
jgi:glycosyltransferase involved in cell wall biosynthesis